MANYIKNEILCEAYSHLLVEIADDPVALEKLKNDMSTFFTERAKFLFGEDVKVEVEFEEGSLITHLKVVGSAAAAILLALNTYGSFRQTVDYLVKDSTQLAQSANLEMVFRTKAAFCDRVRVEKRKGVFGRVDDLLTELDAIKHRVSESKLPRNKKAVTDFSELITDRLIEWNDKVGKLFEKLDHDDTKACVAAGLLEELASLENKVPWELEITSSSFKSTIAQSDPEQAGQLAAAAARYRASAASIKKAFEDLVKQYAPKSA